MASACACWLGLAGTAFAQLPDSLGAPLADTRQISDPWLCAPLAAHLRLSRLPSFGSAGLRYQRAEGDFRRPQSPEQIQRLGFEAEGLHRAAPWAVHGRFGYTKHWDQQQAWANVAQAFLPDLDMALPTADALAANGPLGNPYVWADPQRGNWQRDHVAASVQAALTDSTRRLSPGMALGYQIGQGARQSDPRPFYRYRHLRLAPSVLWAAGRKTWLGLEAFLGSSVEDNEAGQFSTDNFLLYRFRGYGTFDRTPISSAERRVEGVQVGGQGVFHLHRAAGRLQIAAGGSYRRENVSEGLATRRDGGLFEESLLQGSANWWQGRPKGWRQWMLRGEYRQGTATDPLFRAVNAGFTWWHGQLKMTETRTAGHWAHLLEFALHHQLLAPFDEAAATEWRLQRQSGQVQYLAQYKRHYRQSPFVGGLLGYTRAQGANARFNRPTELTNLVFAPDFEVLASSFWQVGAEAGLQWALRNARTLPALRLQVQWQAWLASQGHRHFASLALQIFH